MVVVTTLIADIYIEQIPLYKLKIHSGEHYGFTEKGFKSPCWARDVLVWILHVVPEYTQILLVILKSYDAAKLKKKIIY